MLSRDCSQNIEQFDDIGPCVIMASPGMMQSGLSRQLFEAWCTDKRNGLLIAGYCVEGTLAKVTKWLVIERCLCFYNSLSLSLSVCVLACNDRAVRDCDYHRTETPPEDVCRYATPLCHAPIELVITDIVSRQITFHLLPTRTTRARVASLKPSDPLMW